MVEKDEILNVFKDGLNNLKKIELHNLLLKDPSQKQYLSDIYYPESSMFNFKQTCLTGLERLAIKMDNKPIAVPKSDKVDGSEFRHK